MEKAKAESKKTQDTAVVNRERAVAPYNFIPLNELVIKRKEEQIKSCYKGYASSDIGNLTGYVELDLETITPLYIRNTMDSTKDDVADNQDFFSPGGIIKIPGSSIRGMIRTLVEIVSWGKFGFFDDKLLYYRDVAGKGKSSLRSEYQRNMPSKNEIQAGYLKKDGLEYVIIPAQRLPTEQFVAVEKQDKNKRKEFMVEKQNNGKYLVISGKMPRKENDWLINPPDIPDSEDKTTKISILNKDRVFYQGDSNRYQDKRDKDDREKRDGDLFRQLRISEDDMAPCFYGCWKDVEGDVRVSFGHTRFFRLPYKKTIGDHLSSQLKDAEKNEFIDFAEAIFGKESKFASRVFFEDAELVPGQLDVLMGEIVPKILATPKPTTFQHYLENKPDASLKDLKHWNSEANIRGNKLYWHRGNNQREICEVQTLSFNKSDFEGYCLQRKKYMKAIAGGFEYVKISENKIKVDKPFSAIPKGEFKDLLRGYIIASKKSQHTVIKPVKPRTKFKGKIRFENLSDEELGALLFTLDLPEKCYHKLGMGKPLGLGSIKITPTLILSNRINRYKKLFSRNGSKQQWNLAESKDDPNAYKDKFAAYIMGKIEKFNNGEGNGSSKSEIRQTESLWGNKRLKALKIMLDWSNTEKSNWLEETRYMEIKRKKNDGKDFNEYKSRPVLPKPDGVIS